MQPKEILKLYRRLKSKNEVAVLREFLNHKEDNSAARRACNKLQKLLDESADFVSETIPPLKTLDENFVYSVVLAEKPPFIARTNDPAVIEKIYQIFIRMGGWENAKFLFENLHLNEDIGGN